MADNWMLFDNDFFDRAKVAAAHLSQAFRQNKGVRIGESTVASQKMHTYLPDKPQVVQVLYNVDAGQVFYRRENPGEVCHLDIFHECGLVDHHQVAKALRQTIHAYNYNYAMAKMLPFNEHHPLNPDAVDIQTGTGGGRITGSLRYGMKLSLRQSHLNHVHVAALVPEEHLAILFYIVRAVEDVILEAKLQLRRNERIVHVSGTGGGAGILEFTRHCDTYLQPKNPDQMSNTVKKHQFFEDALNLMDDFDSLEDIKDFLQSVDGKSSDADLQRRLKQQGNNEQVLNRLSGMGIIDNKGPNPKLTAYGELFARYMAQNMPEFEAYFRRVLRLLKPIDKHSGHNRQSLQQLQGFNPQVLDVAEDINRKDVELAITETVMAAAQRMIQENAPRLQVGCEDLRYFKRRRSKKTDICLLIDASASMSGRRIMAAKFLVRHLLVSTPERISVVTFQEQQAKVQVPLTRDYRVVEKSLREIRTFGLTPLGLGLRTSCNYLKEARAHNPLIILITDGVSTISGTSDDPLADALQAASEIKREGFGFTCIGLQPDKDYLRQLADNAGGTLYIVDELEKQILVKTAWQDRTARGL